MLQHFDPNLQSGTILRWVCSATDRQGKDRRKHSRHPLFTPITMSIGDSGAKIAAFTREISKAGFGLIHDQPLENEKVTLHLSKPKIDVTARIERCRFQADDLYLSFGRFENVAPSAVAKLFMETVTQKVQRRFYVRQPFFCPVSVMRNDRAPSALKVFTRDISWSGVGLFHNQPLQQQRVMLSIPTESVDEVVRATVNWCKPCGNGWYTSGATFDRVSMEVLEERRM